MRAVERRSPALLAYWATAVLVLGLLSGSHSPGSMCAHPGEVGVSRLPSSPTPDPALFVSQPDPAALAAASPAGFGRLFARCAIAGLHVPVLSAAVGALPVAHDPADPGLATSGQPRSPPQFRFAS